MILSAQTFGSSEDLASSAATIEYLKMTRATLAHQISTTISLVLPEFEVLMHHAIGESLTTDTNTLEYTIAGQLVEHQCGIDVTLIGAHA